MNLALRHLTSDDTAELFTVIARNREHLATLVWAATATMLSTAEFIAAAATCERRDVYAITVDGSIVGVIELRDVGNGFQLGYWLDHQAVGRGIMSWAVQTITKCHSLPVFAKTWKGNDKSQRVLLRSGFSRSDSDHKWAYFIKPPSVDNIC